MSSVLLLTMPWDILESPSIALGTIQQLLIDGNVPAQTFSFKLAWMDYLSRHQRRNGAKIRIADYQQVAKSGHGIGDWVFARPPVSPRRRVEIYGKQLRASGESDLVRKIFEMRRLVPGFLRECTRRIMQARPKVVGFTTTFNQNVSSLLLSYYLKRADSTVKVVFGGGNCDGPMGAAIHRCFPWVDIVVRGECEGIVVDLFRELIAGMPVRPRAGLCFREEGRQIVVPQQPAIGVKMDDIPIPNYDDYFDELNQYPLGEEIRPKVFLSFETSRGCWWGEVSHCTFCGLNGSSMTFRSKRPDRAVDLITTLARRYQVLDLHAIDNIIDHTYFNQFLPAVRGSAVDFQLFYEVKSNLKKHHVHLLRDARVRQIQPGIESLSTPILRLMRKGVTAFQNVCLLKWCRQYGIQVDWNLLYGFPNEPPEEYKRMSAVLPALVHLSAPHAAELAVHRFSPYHVRPLDHGLELVGPRWYYPYLYDIDDTDLNDIAYEFAYRRLDTRLSTDYVGDCLAAVQDWRDAQSRGASLRFRRGPGFIQIQDRRRAGASADVTLEHVEAAIFLACEDGASVQAIGDSLRAAYDSTAPDERTVRRSLNEFKEAGLVFSEGDRYLALALPTGTWSEEELEVP